MMFSRLAIRFEGIEDWLSEAQQVVFWLRSGS